MKNTLNLVVMLLAFAFLSSCQKEIVNKIDPEIPPVLPHDSIMRLSKIYFVDYRTSATDTTGYLEYNFDSLQRVTSISNETTANAITYYYHGSDTLAYKKIEKDDDPIASSQTTFYFYDNLNRLAVDSTIYDWNGNSEVGKYSYTDTSIVCIRTSTDIADPGHPYVQIDTGLVALGDVYTTNAFLSSSEFYFDGFIYDDKPNPFYTLNIRSTYNPIPDYNFYLEEFYLQKHNITSSIEIYSSINITSPPQTDTYNYTYDLSGFPSMVDIAYDFGQTDDYRMLFVYKKL